ncbi:MAG: NAD-dependent DNA ligase LigA, partial [Bacteroidia bacterium]|nr:NAD-dependent DNA ligase LigA [Bacteroidia bacterium]
MNKKEAKQKIAELTEQINEHNHNYYVLNSPTITDFEYDILLQDLAQLEKLFPQFALPNSPTQTVGSDLISQTDSSAQVQKQTSFEQVAHKYPMLSLSNTYNIEELNAFNDRVVKGTTQQFNYSCELKFDGTAICLTYQNGKLIRALTRGD